MNYFFQRRGLAVVFLLVSSVVTGMMPGDSIRAIHTDAPPRVDGRMDDEAWKGIPSITVFQQREPSPGAPSTLKTEISFLYTDQVLYIGVRCFGDPGQVIAKELARDADLSNDDRVQVILDTYLDHRNAYWFQIGPRGSIGDAIVSENGAAFNKAWDGLWTGKAEITSDGWEAEMALPFKTFNFDPDSDTWGLKLIRYQKTIEEVAYWPVGNINTHRFQVSDEGYLTGLSGISQGIGLDLVPYGLTGLDIREDAPRVSPVLDAGIEAYYNITSSLKAAVSFNTDFAQTEVDRQEINLTRFSLFYPEKRDFFLDGANYFNFGINGDQDNPWNTKLIPFFSRRIGLDKEGNPIPVQYGGKVTGQAGKWNIGAMYMKDQRIGWENGNFAVTRISRNIGKQSQVGLISTYGNALFDTSNFVMGFDVKLATSTFRGDKNLSLSLYGLKSFTGAGTPQADQPGRELSFGAEVLYPNDNLYLRLGHMQIQENFTAGIGFVPRPGVRQTYGDIKLGYRPEYQGILQALTGGGADLITDFSNHILTRKWNLMPLKLRMMSGDEFEYELASTYEFLDLPFDLYSSYTIPADTYNFFWQKVSIRSARKRRLWTSASYRFGQFYQGTRNEIELKAGYKVMVPLFIGGEIVRNDIALTDEIAFVANIYRLNLNVLFSPDITLYSFIQYDSESDKMGWQSRFQWIIRPGKEIFLVWNSIARDPFDRYQMEEAGARLKIKYTLRF